MIVDLVHMIMRRRARQLTARLLRHIPPDGLLLDVGSGTGHNAEAFRSFSSLKVMEMDVVDLNVVGSSVVLFDGRNIPFATRSIDAATLLFVLHYVDDPAGLLSELQRTSRGRLLVMQSVYQGLAGRATLWIRELLQGRLAFHASVALRVVRAGTCPLKPKRYYTRESLEADFSRAGLKIVGHEAAPWPGLGVSRDLYVLEGAGE